MVRKNDEMKSLQQYLDSLRERGKLKIKARRYIDFNMPNERFKIGEERAELTYKAEMREMKEERRLTERKLEE